MDWLTALAPYVPLFQTLLWVVVLAIVALVFRSQIVGVAAAVRRRVESGSSLKAGPLELGEDLRDLRYIQSGPPEAAPPPELGKSASGAAKDRGRQRTKIYEENRGIFLAHVIEPSEHAGQVYDVFIFLIRHKSQGFHDVAKAEFFFGHMWGNQLFEADVKADLIGVSTSAWGPFLCTCRVTLTSGETLDLDRYIDFEMARVFDAPSNTRIQRTAHGASRHGRR